MFGFDLIALAKAAGYIGLFLIIFAESGVLIGLFLPGDSLLFTTGFLASQGYLRIEILIPILFLAAFAGDSVGYFFGKSVGTRIFSRPKSFWFNPENIEKTQRFFEKYGKKTIVLARFMPVVRTLAPILAGVGKMHYETFVFYNAIGAFLWAAGITLLGYIFGNTFPQAHDYVLYVVVIIVGISLAPGAWQFWKERRKRNVIDK